MEEDTNITKICQQSEKTAKEKLQFILTKVEYENAEMICCKLGGKIPLPTKDKDFSATIGNEYFSEPSYRSSCKRLWLPIVQVNFSIAFFKIQEKLKFILFIYFHNIKMSNITYLDHELLNYIVSNKLFYKIFFYLEQYFYIKMGERLQQF